jgi:hypothetical protein
VVVVVGVVVVVTVVVPMLLIAAAELSGRNRRPRLRLPLAMTYLLVCTGKRLLDCHDEDGLGFQRL